MKPKDIARLITEDPNVLNERYCEACGGSDDDPFRDPTARGFGGKILRGHRYNCPAGAPMGSPIKPLVGSPKPPNPNHRPGAFIGARLVESGSVGGGVISYKLSERPDGTRYIEFDVPNPYDDDESMYGGADTPDELHEYVLRNLSDNFYDTSHPEFMKWLEQ